MRGGASIRDWRSLPSFLPLDQSHVDFGLHIVNQPRLFGQDHDPSFQISECFLGILLGIFVGIHGADHDAFVSFPDDDLVAKSGKDPSGYFIGAY
ncbi:hypothetical protein DPM35_00005 [Mesorhizobium atlanticum]|uniref:Uncharacterized protein n=1 Tax=Mesorhizobium atlanticum TaxID=2233532 RepID=A0A330H754_9HYPH|nr:hypothetical protein DPM35_00005 [Mesorhizobium atlanticum]